VISILVDALTSPTTLLESCGTGPGLELT